MVRKRLLTTKEAATVLGTTAQDVRAKLRAGAIEGTKLGARWRVNYDAMRRQFGIIDSKG